VPSAPASPGPGPDEDPRLDEVPGLDEDEPPGPDEEYDDPEHPAMPWDLDVAAIWAETISDFGDLTFLLLPRLPGVAHKAWSAPQTPAQASAWAEHRDRLARHARLWAQDDLTYFRTSAINWL